MIIIIWKETGDITPDKDWSDCLTGVDAVVHLAQRAHVMKEELSDPLFVYRRINVDSMGNLLDQCLQYGVKKFIFISSSKVHGEYSLKPFTEKDEPVPSDPYSISKLEAEKLLIEKCRSSEMSYTIIRPPVIYGPNPTGNIKRLFLLLKRKIPLPFGSVKNNRSMIGISNFVNFIESCISSKKASNQKFLISDDRDLSFTELIESIAEFMHYKPVLIPVPEQVLRFLFS